MNEKLSLTELQHIIRDSLYLALPEMYWVIAEISEMKENYNGHCYLELVEKLPDEINIRSRIRAVIWNNRYRFIKSYFENAAGESLRDGLKILIRVKIEYHEIYGLSLLINDIDPAFTIGEMALRRQQILKKLETEGVLTMNRELEFPVVPQRIAVISSANAAGYTDFMKHLKENGFGYVFYSALFETPMQGKETESGIIKALDRIASHIDKFDLAVIIRGGGSQTDLSWFDNYNIAYYITQFPLPVITGIGHEKDLSVTDIVANRSLKTPTAVADFLIGCMNETDNHIIELSNEIADRSMLMVNQSKMMIETARLRLIPVAKGQLSSNIIALKRKEEILVNALKNRLNLLANKLTGFGNSLKILDPVNVLKRGYTITSLNGKILKKCEQIKKEDVLDTKFSDGSVRSKVLGM
ncbi:MAG TPA: exodeoxyribonuclease VII large subunit [Bacteroidales bacterium]|jgi:exodeoxyribonuclease VII large subunit|nr:exodeoxyribonuclease VII large subunit [Bacteroidales bacterium]HBZ22159.1 exodeoxyribonuclease VII large subunit [Bacteroidales bacterium]